MTEVFRNKKVFLTGHTGFKGAWLCTWLQMMGAQVKGYALKPEKISLYNKLIADLDIESVYADILDKKKLQKAIVSFQPDFIFHLAAQAIVRESYVHPALTFETNVTGTSNVLDATRFLNKKCVCVIVTTDKVYENIEKDYAYVEGDKLGGYDPYSASKAAAEIVTQSYRLAFFNPDSYRSHKKSIATARAGNVIGGGDYAKDRIVPDIFRALSASKSIVVRNPNSVRPWQHVLEPLSGYLSLAAAMSREPQKAASAFNFGPFDSDTCTVEELVKEAIRAWGTGSYKVAKLKNAPHEAGLLKLNIEHAKFELGWQPRWNSKTAIDKSMNWYKKSLNKKNKAVDLCVSDILDYTGKTNG
jgi:CDP-glucose 4,6-dehydratase